MPGRRIGCDRAVVVAPSASYFGLVCPSLSTAEPTASSLDSGSHGTNNVARNRGFRPGGHAPNLHPRLHAVRRRPRRQCLHRHQTHPTCPNHSNFPLLHPLSSFFHLLPSLTNQALAEQRINLSIVFYPSTFLVHRPAPYHRAMILFDAEWLRPARTLHFLQLLLVLFFFYQVFRHYHRLHFVQNQLDVFVQWLLPKLHLFGD